MTDPKRQQYVDERLRALGTGRVAAAKSIGGEGEPDGISGALLLAIGLRESGLRNVLGDNGHARGCFQIHDEYWASFLKRVPGCKAGWWQDGVGWRGITSENWVPVPGRTAYAEGYCPTFEDGCRYAVSILRDYSAQARAAGLPELAAIRTAVVAYNCGFRRALKGYREKQPDAYTAGKDYSADVLRRRTEVNSSIVYKNA